MTSADRFEDLLTWRLLYELSLEVWKFTGEQSVRHNVKYCDQIRDSSDSNDANGSNDSNDSNGSNGSNDSNDPNDPV